MPGEPTGRENSQHYPALAQRLMDLGYIELFQVSDEDALDAIWNEPGAPEVLTKLAVDPEAPALARFLAAEVLFCEQENYPPEEHRTKLASVYATALAQNLPGPANTWGLPGELDGLAGEHFVSLEEDAIPELVGLLDEDTRLSYEGSEEATLANIHHYRVKDLAAFFISEIKEVPFEVHEDPEARDEEIERLRESLRL